MRFRGCRCFLLVLVLVLSPAVAAAQAPLAPAESMHVARVRHTLTRLGDGRVLAAGGGSECCADEVTATAEIFDPSTNQWTPTGSMRTRRGFHTATLLSDGKVLVA